MTANSDIRTFQKKLQYHKTVSWASAHEWTDQRGVSRKSQAVIDPAVSGQDDEAAFGPLVAGGPDIGGGDGARLDPTGHFARPGQ